MVTKEPERRHVGRPRTYNDDEVFLATAAVLARNGHAGLTLAAVAADLGCTAPALNNRFGSKGDLLIAFLEWSTALAQTRFDQVRAEHSSPLAALRDPSAWRPQAPPVALSMRASRHSRQTSPSAASTYSSRPFTP